MTDIIFVADFFYDGQNYLGGAELTTEAIISYCNNNVIKIESKNLSVDFIKENVDKKWIFGNFFFITDKIFLEIIKSKLTYDVIEYDFKYCTERSPQVHINRTGSCNCENEFRGKLISLFFKKSRKCWFMSEKQKQVYKSNFPFLNEDKMVVLSSVFKSSTLEKIIAFNLNKNNKYVIFESGNWLKGTKNCIEYAQKANYDYDLVKYLPYEMMLQQLADSKGLIFLPNAHDTCPRITIEAKLLGCDLVLGDNVLHKDEEWFSGSIDDTLSYLQGNCNKFWRSIHE